MSTYYIYNKFRENWHAMLSDHCVLQIHSAKDKKRKFLDLHFLSFWVQIYFEAYVELRYQWFFWNSFLNRHDYISKYTCTYMHITETVWVTSINVVLTDNCVSKSACIRTRTCSHITRYTSVEKNHYLILHNNNL